MTNPTTTRLQTQALETREAVQESLITLIYRSNVIDQPGYDEASAIAAFDALLTEHGSLGAVLDHLTVDAMAADAFGAVR